MKKLVKPAHADPHNSVDLFDADRTNFRGGPYCIHAAILPERVDEAWHDYVMEQEERQHLQSLEPLDA